MGGELMTYTIAGTALSAITIQSIPLCQHD